VLARLEAEQRVLWCREHLRELAIEGREELVAGGARPGLAVAQLETKSTRAQAPALPAESSRLADDETVFLRRTQERPQERRVVFGRALPRRQISVPELWALQRTSKLRWRAAAKDQRFAAKRDLRAPRRPPQQPCCRLFPLRRRKAPRLPQ